MQHVIVCGTARFTDTLVNRAIMLYGRLTRQALMQLARSAVTAIAVEQPLGGDSIMGNRLAR